MLCDGVGEDLAVEERKEAPSSDDDVEAPPTPGHLWSRARSASAGLSTTGSEPPRAAPGALESP